MSFMVLAESGHIALAKTVHDATLHFAWGTIPDAVAAPETLSASAVDGGTLNPATYTYVVTAANKFGETTASMAATATIVASASQQSIQLNWGASANAEKYIIYRQGTNSYDKIGESTSNTFTDNGSTTPDSSVNPPTTNTTFPSAWTKPAPNPDPSLPDMYAEVGRRKILTKEYVKQDPNGTIETSEGKWSISDKPTKHLYLHVQFNYTDAPDDMIYQFAIFIGTVPTDGNENALYLTPDMIKEKGEMLGIENHTLIIRESTTREGHSVILTF